jgi:hypothetical protein
VNLRSLAPTCRRFAVLATVLLAAHGAAAGDKTARPEEATRVRFLIVADSDAKEGAACAMDGHNLKAVLEAGLGRQKLDGRFTIDMITGREVSPGKVLKYYQDLKVGADEALVFYYSGHGAYHSAKGHLLTFSQGDLSRASVLAAMQQHKPRLAVVLTDCCAIFDDPPPAKPNLPAKQPMGLPGKRTAAAAADGPQSGPAHPPRPPDYKPPSASANTPTALTAHPPRPENYRPPPPFISQFDDNVLGSDNLVLRTADGPLTLKTLLAQTNGEVMRHLFYRHAGLVDISGCEKGKAAFATTRWGGGLFTVNFLCMHKDKGAKFDANRNGLVEWNEFFTSLRANCERSANVLTKGGIRQVPEAMKLGQPIVVAGR